MSSKQETRTRINVGDDESGVAATLVGSGVDTIEEIAKKAEEASLQDVVNNVTKRGEYGTHTSAALRDSALEAVYSGTKLGVMRELDCIGGEPMRPFDSLLSMLTDISALWGGLNEDIFPAKAFLEHLPLLAAVPVATLQVVADELSATPGRFNTFEVTDVHGNTHFLSSRVFESTAAVGMIHSDHLANGVVTVDQLPDEYFIGGAMCCMMHRTNVLFFSDADRNGVGGKTDAEKARWMPLLVAAGLNAAQQKIFFKNPSAFWASGAPTMRRSGPAWGTMHRAFTGKVQRKLVDAADGDFSVSGAVDAFLNWTDHITMPCVGDSMSEGGTVPSSKLRKMMNAHGASKQQILCALACAMLDQEIQTHLATDCVLLPGRPDKLTGLPRYTIVIRNECADVSGMQHVLATRKYTAAHLLGLFDGNASGCASSKRSSSIGNGGGAAKKQRVCFATPIQTLVKAVRESRDALIIQDFDLALFLASVDGWKRFSCKVELLAFIEREFGFDAEQVTAYMVKVHAFLESNTQLMILTANSERNVHQILEWFDCRVPFIFSIYDWRAEVAAKTHHLKLTSDEFSLLHRVLCKGKDVFNECTGHGSTPDAFGEVVLRCNPNADEMALAAMLAATDGECTKAKFVKDNIQKQCPFIFIDDSPSECSSVAAIGGSNGKVLKIKRPDKVTPGTPRNIADHGQFHNHPILRETPSTNPATLLLGVGCH